MRLVFYECTGGSEVEFFAASGSYSAFNSSFRLVGDAANGGLDCAGVWGIGGRQGGVRASGVFEPGAARYRAERE